MTAHEFQGFAPQIAEDVFVAEGAHIIGNVSIAAGSSVWYNSVIRGDVGQIIIGERTNIQDLTMIHLNSGAPPVIIGDDVTVGHRAILHGCTIGNRTLIGMGAIILDDVSVGNDCLIAAGSLLTPGTVVPDGHLVMGSPGRIKRPVTEQEREHFVQSALGYQALASLHQG